MRTAFRVAMHRNVEILIGRLATDAELRLRFSCQPEEVLREQALELTELESRALAATDPEAFCALAAALDGRLRKASPVLEVERNPTQP